MSNWSGLTAYLNQMAMEQIVCGACLIYQGEREVYRHYVGKRDLERGDDLHDNTLYRLYSLTKLATATGVLRLIEDGAIEMDRSVGDYLKEWRGSEITIRHLLTMQSGLSYPYDTPAAKSTSRVINGFRRAHSSWSTREYAGMLSHTPLIFRPGTDFVYGTGYDVLGAVIEEVTGQQFGQFLRETLFAPLEMYDTGFKIREKKDWERLAGIYARNADTRELSRRLDKDRAYEPEFPFEEGGGGLLSTIDDIMKLARMFQRGGCSVSGVKILSQESLKQMTENTLDTERKRRSFRRQFFEWSPEGGLIKENAETGCPYGYGMGVRVRVQEGTFPDSPVGEFGWYGMSGSYMLVDRINEITVIYLQQMIPGMEKTIHPMLRKRVYEGLYED